jgi:3'-5' exonuclease
LTDDFLRDNLKRYHGYVPIKVLLTFPKFHGWTDAQLLVDAFNSTGGDRYIVKFDPKLWIRDESDATKKRGAVKTPELDPSPDSKAVIKSIPSSLQADDVLYNDDLFSSPFQFERDSYDSETDEDTSKSLMDGAVETTALTTVRKVRNATPMNDRNRLDIDSDDDDASDDEWSDMDFDSDEVDSDDEWNDLNDDDDERNGSNAQIGDDSNTQDLDCSSDEEAKEGFGANGIRNYVERNVSDASISDDFSALKYSDLDDRDEELSDHESNDLNLDANEIGNFIEQKVSSARNGDDSRASNYSDMDSSDEESSDIEPNDFSGSDDDMERNDPSTGDQWKDLDFSSDDEITDNEDDDSAFESDDDDETVQFSPRKTKVYDGEDSDDVVISDLESYLYDFDGLFSKPKRKAKHETKPNDEVNHISNAFVRHRRVNLEYIYMLEEEIFQNMSQEDDEHGELDDGFMTEIEEFEQKERKKETRHKEYASQRQSKVVKNAQELGKFCSELLKSAKQFSDQHSSQESAYAVACDVEYCSLELDIRGTLPALIQLSGPLPTGPVGLIWLDKFPNHGRDLLTNPSYAPLAALFADPKLLKVGVSLSNDAINLASWCGVTEKDHRDYFFSGIVDIEEETDENVNGKSLQEMSTLVLGRHLAKIKGKRRSEKDRKKRVPTAHWRTQNMTELMKTYAVNDVSCAMDVWMKIHGLDGSQKGNKSGS